jgi:hypothetical protein
MVSRAGRDTLLGEFEHLILLALIHLGDCSGNCVRQTDPCDRTPNPVSISTG